MFKMHFKVGPLETNCYLIADEITKEAAVIDPGGGSDIIAGAIRDNGLKLKYILLTHGHPDHTEAAPELQREFGVPVFLHPDDKATDKNAQLFYSCDNETTPLAQGDKLYLGSTEISVINTPGHSKGSCVFLVGEDMFAGDTLFAGSCGRVDLPGGRAREMVLSLKRLYDLPGDYNIYPGHMGFSTLERERKTNIYMEDFRS